MTRAYRHEWLLLVLIGLTALSFFNRVLVQDITRLALTQAVTLHGSFRIDRWHEATIDKAEFRGHYYSDKDPGVSYYDPIGGLSPGRRLFVPALPFLAIGLAALSGNGRR